MDSAEIGLLFSERFVFWIVFLGLLRLNGQRRLALSSTDLTLSFIDLLAGLLGAMESTLHTDHLEFSVILMGVIQ